MMRQLSIYAFLFASGMANESLLTYYYSHASHGETRNCVLASLAQQAVCIVSSFYTLADCPLGSRECIKRWIIVALSYGFASYLVVG